MCVNVCIYMDSCIFIYMSYNPILLLFLWVIIQYYCDFFSCSRCPNFGHWGALSDWLLCLFNESAFPHPIWVFLSTSYSNFWHKMLQAYLAFSLPTPSINWFCKDF